MCFDVYICSLLLSFMNYSVATTRINPSCRNIIRAAVLPLALSLLVARNATSVNTIFCSSFQVTLDKSLSQMPEMSF